MQLLLNDTIVTYVQLPHIPTNPEVGWVINLLLGWVIRMGKLTTISIST